MKFLATYIYQAKRWGITIDADDWLDAERRCKVLNAELDGELVEQREAYGMEAAKADVETYTYKFVIKNRKAN